ncbi:unnamed protein product [Arctia plantaginis]|uniref:Zinc finger PHD-type domain-containing protein n=1 Tax=Arctia plantaginis TaxID=874455 RepID=A0A8S1BPK3_ARCPL|nr:unnamed protein product [Arctia plantaginis]
MANCAACGKFTSSKGVAVCCRCNKKYHLPCLRLPDATRVSREWQCQDCKNNIPKDRNQPSSAKETRNEKNESSPTSSYDSSQSTGGSASKDQDQGADIAYEIKLMRAEMKEMGEDIRTELRELRLEMADLRQTVATYKKKVDHLESRLDDLERKQATSPEVAVDQLEHTVKQLQTELGEREQELLLSDIEISNLPESPCENVFHSVELVAKKLGVTLEHRDIVFAERVGPRVARSRESGESAGAARCRRIVVRLARRGLREELLRSARVRRGATSADLGIDAPSRRFYLNERLTRTNKHLFYRARQAAASLGWRFTWTSRGRVLTKEADGKRTYVIRSEADLEQVFGKETVTASKD